MIIDDGLMRRIVSDLGLNLRFDKNSTTPVRNCWHFMTDGNAVGVLFRDDEDFRFGMNLIYLMTINYKVIILAFTLMDTHVHFILYGDFDECNRMMHEYLRRISIYLSSRYDARNYLSDCPLQHQAIDDDKYLKTAICYVLKNAPSAGIPFNAWDYPWSSGSLYFRSKGFWNSCDIDLAVERKTFSIRQLSHLFHGGYSSREENLIHRDLRINAGVIHPGEYVAWEIVEKIFLSHRSYNYFLCRSKASDVDSRGGVTSYLTLPMQEMRMHKRTLCRELFGVDNIRTLDTGQRLMLAKALRSRYNSSKKQILRLCGLVYSEAEKLI